MKFPLDKFQELKTKLELMINARTHRERLSILFMGFFLIVFLWYILLENPLLQRQAELQKQIAILSPQIRVLNQEYKMIIKESASNSSEEKLDEARIATLKLASSGDLDNLMTALLTPAQNIDLTGFKSSQVAAKPASADNNPINLSFQSNYFDTIAYLTELEKLPWCLSWDSLEYKVANYPNADVIINLHLVKK